MNKSNFLAILVILISCGESKKDIDTNIKYDNNRNTVSNISVSSMITYSCDYLEQDYPFLSPDGNKIYFTSDRPIIPGKKRTHRSEGDIWYIERQAGGWSDPIHLGDKINFGNRHSIGSVSASGNMYFTVRTGTRYSHQTKIYFSECKNGKYSNPTIIKELDSDQPSHSPFVAPDESYLIYSSFRGGYGMSDLFISFKDSAGRWTHPKNLGSSINSDAKDEYPYITPDGEYLFFNSSRVSDINKVKIQNGPGNMYWVKANFKEELRKQLD